LTLIRRLVDSRWFALADLVCVVLSAILWLSQPAISGWPLFIALLPWAARLAAGRFPFRRTPLDLLLVAFLITAAVGVWAAYDREAAWAKFWVLVSAILFYSAVAGQPRSNLWLVAGLLGAIGVGMAGYFLLTNDWRSQPVKFQLIDRMGLWWMSVRPTLPAPPIHPNDAAYIISMMTPFLVAHGLRARRERRWRGLGVAAAALGLVLISLLLTISRGAWVALSAALGIWLLWRLSDWVAGRSGQPRSLVFILALLLVAGVPAGVVWAYPGGPGAFLSRLLGPVNSVSRTDLELNTLPLVADFLFTGGGLRAFPGLYSRYVLVIPDYFLVYSHNLFLDIALEQGVVGLLAFLGVIVSSLWWLIWSSGLQKPTVAHADLLRWATAASWIAVAVHGLVDDTLYGDQGSPILFLLAGLAIALAQPGEALQAGPAAMRDRPVRRVWIRVGGAVALLLAACGLYGFRQVWLSNWYSNLGAVEMARSELAGWPAARWDQSNLVALAPAEALFRRALQLHPDNMTAHYRLGLIAGRQGDYATAVAQLSQIYAAGRASRGARKVLGYIYVWMGLPDRAADLLTPVPEAGYEMSIYAWWWQTQGRDDLAARAAQMAERLNRPTALSPK